MIRTITVRERGAVPRRMRAAYNKAAKASWVEAGKWWHANRRDLRFSVAHGRKAGYLPRKGEETGLSRAEFFRSYTGRKLRRWGHRRPLEFSGETRRMVRSVSITASTQSRTNYHVRLAYAGARKFNFRNPHSQIRMADEFRRLTPEEPAMVGSVYDAGLNKRIDADKTENTVRA